MGNPTLHKSFLPFCEMWVGVRVRLYCVLFVNNFMKIPGMDTCNSCRYNQVFLHRHAGTKAQANNSENIEPRILPHPSFLLKDVIYFRYKSTTSPHRPAVAVILTLQIIYCILGNLSIEMKLEKKCTQKQTFSYVRKLLLHFSNTVCNRPWELYNEAWKQILNPFLTPTVFYLLSSKISEYSSLIQLGAQLRICKCSESTIF